MNEHVALDSKLLAEADWVLLASPRSEVGSEQIKLITNFIGSENLDKSIFVFGFTYDNIGKVEIIPLVDSMGWFDSRFVSGPVVLVHSLYIQNFETLKYSTDESLFWLPVVKSALVDKAIVMPIPAYIGVTLLDRARIATEFDHHDLHREVLNEFEKCDRTPWHYQELVLALTSANKLDSTKSKLVFKLERISTRILFPAGTIRRTFILRVFKALKLLG
jgi:hypothetical protein